MRIAVYGAGGIGGFMGARLWQAGHDVALVARGEHLRAIQSSGLQVEAPDSNFTVIPRIATDDPAQVGVVDLVNPGRQGVAGAGGGQGAAAHGGARNARHDHPERH